MSTLNGLLFLTLCAMLVAVWFAFDIWWRTGGLERLLVALARWDWAVIAAWLGMLAIGVASLLCLGVWVMQT